MKLTFLYSWYGGNSTISPIPGETWRHWHDNNHTPPTNWFSNYQPTVLSNSFDPNINLYSSRDPALILDQLGLIKRAHLDGFIYSWWGQNSYEDQTLNIIANQIIPSSSNPYPNVKFTIYYELDGQGIDVPESQIISDINSIIVKYSNNPNLLKIDCKPVIFVYNIATNEHGKETDLQKLQKWNNVRGKTNIYTVMKVFKNFQNYLNLADSWHQYGPAVAFGELSPFYAYISPGFYKSGESSPRLTRDPAIFNRNAQKLASSSVQWKLVETWNEYGEGTQVEPAQPINPSTNPYIPSGPSYQTEFIDILAKYL